MRPRPVIQAVMGPVLIGLLWVVCWGSSAQAAGQAGLTLAPANGNLAAGSNLNVTIHESSTDPINAVEADLTYDPKQLQYVDSSVSGTNFDLNVPPAAASGSLKFQVARSGADNGITGDQAVATINFKVLAKSGTAAISFAPSSSVIRSSDFSNIWDSQAGGGSYTLSAGAAGGSSAKSQPAPTATPSGVPAPASPQTFLVAVRVYNQKGQPVRNAKVALEDGQVAYSDNSGTASFSKVTAGNHSLTVTQGKVRAVQPIVVGQAGIQVQEFVVLLKASGFNAKPWILGFGVILIIALVFSGLWRARRLILNLWPKGHLPVTPRTVASPAVPGATLVQPASPTSLTLPPAAITPPPAQLPAAPSPSSATPASTDLDINPVGAVFYPDQKLVQITKSPRDSQ